MAVCKTEKPLPRSTLPSAVLFDLGNTLAAYYRPSDFGPILERAVDSVLAELAARGIATVARDHALAAAHTENREAADFQVLPMQHRLARIFALDPSDTALADALCARFLEPIFAIGRVYDEVPTMLDELRSEGFRIAIVSNAPWGSPTQPWRAELGRLGLGARVDAVVLCGDVGWRKPARAIFDRAVLELGVSHHQCVFVGDELQWDVEGARAAGMRPILIDRDDRHRGFRGERIRDLRGLRKLCRAD